MPTAKPKYIAEIDSKRYEVNADTVEYVPGQGRVTFHDSEGQVVASFTGNNINVYKDSDVKEVTSDGGS